MGGAPQHNKLKQSANKDVAILWDMDDVLCPPNEDLCRSLIEGLRKVTLLLCTGIVRGRSLSTTFSVCISSRT